jgi:multifunctional 2-oxoglutarate metabolism enzyme
MPPRDSNSESRIQRALDSVNAGYVQQMYEQYQRDPASVEPEWRSMFESGAGGFQPASPPERESEGNGAGAADRATERTTERTAERTTEEAAERAPEQRSPEPEQATPEPPKGGAPIKGPAARLAQNMTASLAIPTATSFREIDVAALEARRRQLNEALAPKKISFTHLIGFAIVRAAATEHPGMTHAYAESEGQAYRVDPDGVNLGLAVDVERPDGSRFLVVPVIKGAHGLDFAGFHARYEELVEKARTNKLSPDDFAGATITLTNPGTLGTTASVPRLMPGQGTIVATGAIRQVGDARRMTLTSTYDHRIIQGAESGAFLRSIDRLLGGEDDFYAEVFGPMGAGEPEPIEQAPPQASVSAAAEDITVVAAAVALVRAYRHFGHRLARLDPLGSEPEGDPALDPGPLGLTAELMARIPSQPLRISVPGETLAEALPNLHETYCGTIAYEVEHIASHEERVWLRQVIESGEHRRPLSPDEQKALLARLTRVETLERFLHKAYLGQKRFSIEGLDAMVPMLDVFVRAAAEGGARDVVIGMAHRGRLNVLAHIVGLSYDAIIAEFEAGKGDGQLLAEGGGMDDVKYHLGAEGLYTTAEGRELTVVVSPNPSHLEAVNPVVSGRTRAEQTDRSGPIARVDHDVTLPVLIHGDAAFAGQGVVQETLNLARLPGYTVGGTIHLIANNQVGFTTAVREARSTDYSSDLAKGFDIPIVHVNADDPEACLAAARLAMMYRETFDADFVIDLVGYRRYGHNESDEPSYTQPRMYESIRDHPSVRELYQRRLVEAGAVSADEAEEDIKTAGRELARRQAAVRRRHQEPQLDRGPEDVPRAQAGEPATSVPAETLQGLNRQLYRWPEGFSVNSKLEKQLERRRDAVDGDEPKIEWGHAESLAFASLLTEGTPIRLTGQDTVRGTFSHRHQTLFDTRTGEAYTPIQHLEEAKAAFELHNSPLSEYGCLGFEYGYAVTAPEALVCWEAQFGDFVNGAEIIVDQFIIAGLAKWRQTSRLTLLLPHGYEGQGPEHSSARLERFLSLAAEGNIRIVNPTTPAQYFHLLRRQAHHAELRPLVALTPKSLLRLPSAASRLSDLASGRFQPVLDDPERKGGEAAAAVKRVILCSGKVYYDLVLSDHRAAAAGTAIVRLEQLYPLPTEELQRILDRYPNLERLIWVQEEPRNMGARKFLLPRFRHMVPYTIPLGDVSRPDRSRPAEGYPAAHVAEQARIVAEAFDVGSTEARDRGGA